MKNKVKVREIKYNESLAQMPNICVVCGKRENLQISKYVFSYKTPIGLLGGMFASLISFGTLSVNLSYSLEHHLPLKFCGRCLKKNGTSERDGIIVAVLFFLLGGVLLFAGIILDDLAHKSRSPIISFLLNLPLLGIVVQNALPIFLITMFLLAVTGVIMWWFVAYLRSPKAAIFRREVLLKIPNNETVKIIFEKPKVKLNVG